MSLLEVEGLTKRYGSLVAVDDLSFAVPAGQTLGLLGPNGAGKTTTMSCIVGLTPIDGGRITIDGQAPQSLPAKGLVGYAAQRTALYPSLRVDENLHFYGGLYGRKGAALADAVDRTVELFDLGELLSRPAKELSVGQAKLVHIATTVLHEPRLLIVDEPTAGLDVAARGRVIDGIRSLAAEGVAVIFSTHYMEEAEEACDALVIIDHGRLAGSGPLDELLAAHQEPATVITLRTGETLTFPDVDLLAAIKSVDQDLITEVVVERPTLRRLYDHLTGASDV